MKFLRATQRNYGCVQRRKGESHRRNRVVNQDGASYPGSPPSRLGAAT